MQNFFKCRDISCGDYKNVDFRYNLEHKNNNRQNRERNIIQFNLPFSQAVSTNVAKRFLDLLDKHFPPNNQLHKILNRNTAKVNNSCTPNVVSIIKSHKKKLINAENKQTKDCNCRKKEECPLEGKGISEDSIYQYVVTTTGHPQKVYLGKVEGHQKRHLYQDTSVK